MSPSSPLCPQVLMMLRSTGNHGFGNNWSHLVHSFKGRFVYNIDYGTTRTSTALATAFSSSIYGRLREALKA